MTTAQGFWDGAAAKYADRPVKDVPAYEKTLERVRAHLNPSDSVLELGCGTGTTALKLADIAARFVATDISANMIGIARQKARDQAIDTVSFRVATLGDGSLGTDAYDVVTAFNFLHLLPDPPAALAEIRALVKPGGLFISKTVCLQGPMRAMWLPIAVMRLIGKAPYLNFFNTARLERWIESEGFEILETGDYPASPPSHFVVARRM